MSLAAVRSTVSRRVCLLCQRSVNEVSSLALRSFAARARPATTRNLESEQSQSTESIKSLPAASPSAAPRQRGRPRKVLSAAAASTPQPEQPQLQSQSEPQPQPQPRTPSILELLLPQTEPDQPSSAALHSASHSQIQQVSKAKEEDVKSHSELSTAATAAAGESTSADVAGETSILDLLRPQAEDETTTATRALTPRTTTNSTTNSDALDNQVAHDDKYEEDDVLDSLPAGSAHDPDAANAALLSADTSISDAEFDRFMTEPITTPPTFDAMEQQVDSLLRLEIRGRRMFPLYMRDQLKLATLTHMRDVIQQLFPQLDPAAATATTATATALTTTVEPVTQHTLHSRLFTFLIKRASKLAHTTDERITILCPEAPAVGEKVPHPQWPEMTTVVRRDFAVSYGGEMGIELEDEERVLRAGKVKMRELFSGLGMDSGSAGFMMDDGDMLVDLDQLNVDAMQFREETEEIPPPPQSAPESAHIMYHNQVEARQHAVAFLKERIRKLQQRRQMYLNKAAADGGLAGAAGSGGSDVDANAMTKEGGTHVLAVVYKFDGESGEEFEIRYPLSKRDVERMQLFEEDDEAQTVIPMNHSTDKEEEDEA